MRSSPNQWMRISDLVDETSSREENSDLDGSFVFTFFSKKAEKNSQVPQKTKKNCFLSQMREFWTLTSSGVRIEPELERKNNLIPSLNSSGAQFEPKLKPKNNSSIQIVEQRGRLASFPSSHFFLGGGVVVVFCGVLSCFSPK